MDRLTEVLRYGGSLALTTEEAQSKSEALRDAGFLAVDLNGLPEPTYEQDGARAGRLAIGSVSMKTTWGDGETPQEYATRHMEIALDHIAAAKWVTGNPPPPPPVYREERRALLVWQKSSRRYPLSVEYGNANADLHFKALAAGFSTHYGDTRLLDVREDGDRFLHLFGVEVTRKVRVEEQS